MTPSFNGVELTPITIQRTREHFADLYRAVIRDILSGETRVNDVERAVAYYENAANDILSTERFSVTFLQRAHWLQTGECVALLP